MLKNTCCFYRTIFIWSSTRAFAIIALCNFGNTWVSTSDWSMQGGGGCFVENTHSIQILFDSYMEIVIFSVGQSRSVVNLSAADDPTVQHAERVRL